MDKTIGVSVVLLAAGLSTRMGTDNKLHLPINGEALLNHAINNFQNAGLQDIVVVLGYQHEESADLLQGKDVTCVVNHDYLSGQVSSVRRGLAKTNTNSEAIFMALGDQPKISEKTVTTLLDVFENRGTAPTKQAIVPYFKGKRGNPVLISDQARQEILAENRDYGCREYMDSNPELVLNVELDDKGVITDLDTMDDYQNYCSRI